MYIVTKLHYHQKSNILDIYFDDDKHFALSCEFLRTHSPSAEVQNHGAGVKLVLNKHNVSISKLEPVGHYAIRLCFDDAHNSGLYSWQYLRTLCVEQAQLWDKYLQRVQAHKESEHSVPIKFMP
ncbi:hypothetical protein PSECIP111951_02816 [Pseudoalteromonas holothuriae]|uniref:Gamma-butyrobetaine hydroxylase-like N-terminal domain-containing protein n=1 Tax=Pseudoalteromonas holothuriae TaxID=2963714 RepID=A0A9W4W311_9GAMM|nr:MULTISPECIES: gamma-butyrobetaine hydroxylase-like domain-containing protein [unclassified Pseudoalteromonas]CAH9055508.1 hypothetical protein PSECIP111854_01594 [Pseudoalteromonas sp. CIP111854]CAH9063000.1 hypothetical protein PSECIP111951_02816 [Pseudoalteromonas sp. CIP111951]